MSEPFDLTWHPRDQGDGAQWDVPTGWGQGRAVFGGLLGAAAHSLSKPATPRPLRTLQMNLLAPVQPGPLVGELNVLRDGSTTTVTEVRLRQGERLMATATLTFVQPRPSSRAIVGEPAPAWGEPEQYTELPYLEGLVPEFTQKLTYYFVEGGFPFSGQPEPLIGGYVRLRDSEATSTEAQLVLLDAWPCPTITLFESFVPASTVTWSVHLLAPLGPGFARFRYRTVLAKDGLSTSVGTMWGSDGRMVAYSEQSIAVFDGN